jgi:hypothetical protein
LDGGEGSGPRHGWVSCCIRSARGIEVEEGEEEDNGDGWNRHGWGELLKVNYFLFSLCTSARLAARLETNETFFFATPSCSFVYLPLV